MRSRGTRIALRALIALAVGLVLLEVAVRARQLWKHGTTAGYYQLEDDPESGLRIPVAGQRAGGITVNSLGFRGPEIELPKPEGLIRIAFLGGSTTFCAHASSDARTWPALVVEGLREAHPGLDFDYVNGGTAGYSTAQSLQNLRHRVAPLEPDVVVIYHGTNDLTHDSRELAIAAGLHDPDADEPSWLAGISVAWELFEKNLRWRRRTSDEHAKLAFDPASVAAPFRARLEELVDTARETADQVVLITFTPRQRRDQAPAVFREASRSSLFFMPWLEPEDILAGYETLNATLRDVARAKGTILVEDEHSIPPDGQHFVDSVHFLDPGERKQADRVLAALERSDPFQAFLGGH
ncbi:MAG: SGNH/GDSL hydrolase family protein [Planctomycetota bacterium]|nr:SGNH/GDSL hydrolase family protein [Planctomycetota bacterium]